MIKRIFTVSINPEKRNNFEKDFHTISIQAVESQKGFVSVEIGTPTKWNPNDYLMISLWESEESLINFAGEDWNKSVIPKGMEQYVVSCKVEHYYIEPKE